MNVFEILLIIMKNGALLVDVLTSIFFNQWLAVPGVISFSIFEMFINPFMLVALFTAVGIKKVVPLL
jgi:general stress protein CsbA